VFDDALRFVGTAFPRLSEREIKKVLKDGNSFAAYSETGIDMDRVMDNLLSQEYTANLQERGLEKAEYDAMEGPTLPTSVSEPVPCLSASPKKKSGKGRTIALNDVRQQHHITPVLHGKNGRKKDNRSHGAMDLDPWSQLSSLSDFFASLIPRITAIYFQPYLHKPDYGGPSGAIRAAINDLAAARNCLRESDPAALVGFLEVLHASHDYCDDLNLEKRDQLIKDSGVALSLCDSPDNAHALVCRLVELDMDAITDKSEGVYHSKPSAISPSASTPSIPMKSTSLAPQHIQSTKDPPFSNGDPDPAGEWITAPRRPPKLPHPLAQSIPAYNKAQVNGNGNSSEPLKDRYHSNQQQAWRRRKDLLKQASHYWRQGSRVGGSKSVGGSIAFFYANRARELADQSRSWGLERAIASIESKRSTGLRNVIDLHGLTVDEAKAVVENVLQQGTDGCSQDRPLEIITGVGRHSANKVGVLLPAIQKKLTEEGWNVRTIRAGLKVSGKTTNFPRYRH